MASEESALGRSSPREDVENSAPLKCSRKPVGSGGVQDA